jgi:hypothetical protein
MAAENTRTENQVFFLREVRLSTVSLYSVSVQCVCTVSLYIDCQRKQNKILKSCPSVMVTLYSTSNNLHFAMSTTYNIRMFTE